MVMKILMLEAGRGTYGMYEKIHGVLNCWQLSVGDTQVLGVLVVTLCPLERDGSC